MTKTILPATPLQYLVHFLENAIQNLSNPKEAASAIQKAICLAKDLDPYLNKNLPPEEENLKKLAKLTKKTDWEALFTQGKTSKKLAAQMLSGAYECHFLKMIAHLIYAKRILEIGMFTGYSTLSMVSALPKEGFIVTCEEEPYLAELAQPFFESSGYHRQIQVRVGPALQTLKSLTDEKQTFDMVFIDANKAEYIDYYLAIKNGNLLTEQGIIIADNTLMKGLAYSSIAKKTTQAKSVVRFNKLVNEDQDVEQIILPIRDGVSVIRKV